ncbi:hypothetical protein PSHT_07006 [Puccinia striiformis]|uniref:Uncharacterized protein n=1 Tax=Puccinia striiformis TaxID=27350 RepID=A0A2S4W1V9_9BASI|nr:hypothetical protein PSHT_07006 [Puccinia striiformis]
MVTSHPLRVPAICWRIPAQAQGYPSGGAAPYLVSNPHPHQSPTISNTMTRHHKRRQGSPPPEETEEPNAASNEEPENNDSSALSGYQQR